jgi:hypothetical protein
MKKEQEKESSKYSLLTIPHIPWGQEVALGQQRNLNFRYEYSSS